MAPGAPGAAVPAGAATRALRLSAFRLRIFFLTCGAKKAGTTTCAFRFAVSVLCKANCEWLSRRHSLFALSHSSGAQPRRENEIFILSLPELDSAIHAAERDESAMIQHGPPGQARWLRRGRLDLFAHSPISGGGTPLPTEGRLSGRIGHDVTDPLRAAACAAFFVWTLRQAPRLEPAKPRRRIPRPFASRQSRQSKA